MISIMFKSIYIVMENNGRRLIMVTTNWWNYKLFSLNLFVFSKFSIMNRHFCNKQKSIIGRRHFQSSLLVQKRLGC